MSKYHIKNKISKKELRKHGKELIPLMNINLTKVVLVDTKRIESRRKLDKNYIINGDDI